MSNPRINVFLIGAQKAGTTSLYHWLEQHPDISAPAELKDYHFFTNPNLFKKGLNHLNNFYKSNEKVKLHGAVNYLYFSEIAAKRLHEYNPKAKIIVCLRNPVRRAISAYKFCIRTLQETLSFEEALKREEDGKLNSYTELANNSYISHGKYADQIYDFLKYFPVEQLHFVFFEELTDKIQQGKVMKGILTFLGLNPEFNFFYKHHNLSGQPKSKALNFIMNKSKTTKMVKVFLPFRLRRRIAKHIEEKNISPKNINVEISEPIKEKMCLIYEKDIKELSPIVKRDLYKQWLSGNGWKNSI